MNHPFIFTNSGITNHFFRLHMLGLCLLFLISKGISQELGLDLSGRWEGTLTQEEGGVFPDYKMVLVLYPAEKGIYRGYSEVWRGEYIYVKTEVEGSLIQDFFMQMEDKLVIQSKEVEGQIYCSKNYQLIFKKRSKKMILQGKWQGTTHNGPCVPGEVKLQKKVSRV